METDALIGYPPARVWGCPTTAMWVYRVGAEKAKRMLFTGDLITGVAAEQMGLITAAVDGASIDEYVASLVGRIAAVPKNQLMMQKMVVNQAIELQGMGAVQSMATLFDGMARHSPEGLHFKELSEKVGFGEAVKQRDSGLPIASEASKPSHVL
jgi:enoyl-CoA hydratase